MDARFMSPESIDDLEAIAKKLKGMSFGHRMLITGAIIALDAADREKPPTPDTNQAS